MPRLIFVGFANSEKFLAAVDRTRPINLSVARRHGKADRRFGMRIDATVLTMSQVQGSEVIYFEHATHRYSVLNGEIFEKDKDRPHRLAEQVREFAERYLTESGVTWRDAMVSMPVNFVTLDGDAVFLKWDQRQESYLYIDHAEVVS